MIAAVPTHDTRSGHAAPAESGVATAGPPLRVGFVMHKMQYAGAEVLVAEMVRRLAAQLDPTIICLDGVGALGEDLIAEGFDVISLDRRPGIDVGAAARLARVVRERDLQLLHAHQYTPFFYSALARLRGARSCRLVFTEHGRHYPDVVSPKRRWANRLVLSRLADASTACCRFAADAVEQKDGFRRGSVRVLANGIDLEDFCPDPEFRAAAAKRLGLDADLKYVTAVARFHPIKDHRVLVRAFAQAAERHPDARLLLVGDGPERPAIERLVDQLGLGETVQFWGVRKDIPDILAASDLFVLSSLSEAASLTLLEAMACGTPVVVTDVGGNPEIVRQGVEGLLTPRGDHGAMGVAIDSLLSHPERAAQMGRAGRARVEQLYRLDATLDAYLRLFRQVIGG